MKKILLALSAITALMLGGITTSTATATAAVDKLEIVNLGYNARGADSIWNRNKEYVDIRASEGVSVVGLKVYDRWGKSNGDSVCNRFEVTSLPVADGATAGVLPEGHTLRVHTGWGHPSVTGTRHNVYMNSGGPGKASCGYKGHIWNNLGDTAYISLDGAEESFTYDFENGYYVR